MCITMVGVVQRSLLVGDLVQLLLHFLGILDEVVESLLDLRRQFLVGLFDVGRDFLSQLLGPLRRDIITLKM